MNVLANHELFRLDAERRMKVIDFLDKNYPDWRIGSYHSPLDWRFIPKDKSIAVLVNNSNFMEVLSLEFTFNGTAISFVKKASLEDFINSKFSM